jgi:hypothetical protein
MPDTRDGREEQARDAERRQRQRELVEALARGDEPEPVPELEAVDAEDLAAVESGSDALSYPATGEAVVERVGDAVYCRANGYELGEDNWLSV